MKRGLHRFGKFYSKVIINYIGIFIFIGILSVVFGEHGWMPNKNIYAISQFTYKTVIPILIAYAGGKQAGPAKEWENSTQIGGVIAVMAVSGMIIANDETGILAAMIFGPLCGLLWKHWLEPMTAKVKTGLEMLTRNILVAFTGCVMALLGFYFIAPIITGCVNVLMVGVNYLIEHRWIWLLSVIIEPAKVFFLNNSMNHGILIPLGLQQAERAGESLLFLLETNPGPGFGILLALYLEKKTKREKYAASMFVQLIGGIHEIYFPEVLTNIWLLEALICGGAAGDFCFVFLHAAATGVISPGSIITMFFMCTPNRILSVLAGIFISALVSMAVAIGILRWQKKNKQETTVENRSAVLLEEESGIEDKMIRKIGVICNAGVGSSAMGAALFRRMLKEQGLTDIEVSAYAADQMPNDLDLVICQRDLKEVLLSEVSGANVYTVESLMNQAEYIQIIEKIQKREG